MTDKLPLINTLVFRGEEVIHPSTDILPTRIEVTVTNSWAKPGVLAMKPTIAREVGIMLIREGVHVLTYLHKQTVPVPFLVIAEESYEDE